MPAVEDKSPPLEHRPGTFSLRTLLAATLVVAMVAGAARMYLLSAALTPRGIVIAALMVTIGVAVGTVVAQSASSTPRFVLLTVGLLFYAGLAGGQLRPGEPLVMWAFLCASAGMMGGAAFGGRR